MPHLKKYKAISRLVGQSTELLFCATNSLDTQKGASSVRWDMRHSHAFPSFAYVEFAEPEHIDAALTMDNSLFRGRLIKVDDPY